MIKIIVLIAAFALAFPVFGQENNPARHPSYRPTKKELEIETKNHNCIKKTKNSFTARLKNYPFNLAAQIQIVSFENNGIDSLPRLNDTICYSKLKEVRTLTFTQVDSLTDIFYNYGFGGPVYTISTTNCYLPRNAILFLDSSGAVFEFIEICFECEKTSKSSEKISLGEMCDQKMDMLKRVFEKRGIKYGISAGLTIEED